MGDSLDHVEDALVFVQPNVVVRDGDVLESDFFRVLEERVRAPHRVEPRRGQQTIVGSQVVRETQPVVLPCLREENVRRVRLRDK